jgi:hypothetical protein
VISGGCSRNCVFDEDIPIAAAIFLVYIRRQTYDVCENGEISCGRHRLVFLDGCVFLPSLVPRRPVADSFGASRNPNVERTAYAIWMEIAVALSRVFLFALILAKMADTNLGAVFRKVFWDSWNRSLTAQMKKNWPHAVIAQIVVFVAVLYWLMSQKGKGINARGAGGTETANTGNVPV